MWPKIVPIEGGAHRRRCPLVRRLDKGGFTVIRTEYNRSLCVYEQSMNPKKGLDGGLLLTNYTQLNLPQFFLFTQLSCREVPLLVWPDSTLCGYLHLQLDSVLLDHVVALEAEEAQRCLKQTQD